MPSRGVVESAIGFGPSDVPAVHAGSRQDQAERAQCGQSHLTRGHLVRVN
jgi:hypothetical protein